jgi:hypothetical protein
MKAHFKLGPKNLPKSREHSYKPKDQNWVYWIHTTVKAQEPKNDVVAYMALFWHHILVPAHDNCIVTWTGIGE